MSAKIAKIPEDIRGITSISVSGFKAIAEERSIDIKRLTLLCGANSSGKSSILQPVLLLKQTLDAPYDPGSLRIAGPNVLFTKTEQLFSHIAGKPPQKEFLIRVGYNRENDVTVVFCSDPEEKIKIKEMRFTHGNSVGALSYGMKEKAISRNLYGQLDDVVSIFKRRKGIKLTINVERVRCFLGIRLMSLERGEEANPLYYTSPAGSAAHLIPSILHVPGLRGNPERTYKTTAISSEYPGLFSEYVASIIFTWQKERDENLGRLAKYMKKLKLTWRVDARAVDDTRVEIRVGRMPVGKRGGSHDMVSIADVGFGVSQTLPVLVALLTAEPGQLVFLEQPELHLHPSAQVGIAELLVETANRGVRLVVETHSAIILLTIQALVAEQTITSERIALHWFSRRTQDGVTEINSSSIDRLGTLGEWPVDFGDLELELQSRFLDAYERSRKTA